MFKGFTVWGSKGSGFRDTSDQCYVVFAEPRLDEPRRKILLPQVSLLQKGFRTLKSKALPHFPGLRFWAWGLGSLGCRVGLGALGFGA